MITVETRYAERDALSPALVVQITKLVDSYMIWVGTTEQSEENAAAVSQQGNIAKDWAVAMPSLVKGIPAPATSLFRSSGIDIALSMAQRLAKRFDKQIFLSLDTGEAGAGVEKQMEKAIIMQLNSM